MTDHTKATAADVKADLEGASEEERKEIVSEELQRDNPRKTVLEAAGLDPNKRYDASGRELFGWEVAPKAPEN